MAHIGRMAAARFQQMVNHKSGLLGVSGTSSDLRNLLAQEGRVVRAAIAVALSCYQAKKWIGSFAAALGGLDTRECDQIAVRCAHAAAMCSSSAIVESYAFLRCAGLGLRPSQEAAWRSPRPPGASLGTITT